MAENKQPQKRYVAIFSCYIYADNAKDAVRMAKQFASKQAKLEDNQFSVDELYSMPFGSLLKGDNILRTKSLTEV